jgi:hypothetical protein
MDTIVGITSNVTEIRIRYLAKCKSVITHSVASYTFKGIEIMQVFHVHVEQINLHMVPNSYSAKRYTGLFRKQLPARR